MENEEQVELEQKESSRTGWGGVSVLPWVRTCSLCLSLTLRDSAAERLLCQLLWLPYYQEPQVVV